MDIVKPKPTLADIIKISILLFLIGGAWATTDLRVNKIEDRQLCSETTIKDQQKLLIEMNTKLVQIQTVLDIMAKRDGIEGYK